jgi:hypothetical protein
MFQTAPRTIQYHGWEIEILADAEETWFRCYHSSLPDFCNDGWAYPDEQSAFVAACAFVDREIAVLALIDLVQDWWVNHLISDEEYWNLTRFDECLCEDESCCWDE